MTATPMGPADPVQGEFYLFLAAVVLAGLGFMAAVAAVQRRGGAADPAEREQPSTFVLGAGLFLLAVSVALVLQSFLSPLLDGPPPTWPVLLLAGLALLVFWYLVRPPEDERDAPERAEADERAEASGTGPQGDGPDAENGTGDDGD